MNYKDYKIAMFLCLWGQVVPPDLAYVYEVVNGEANLLLYYGDKKRIVVPTEIDGYPVTSIECTCYSFNDQVQSIEIPEGITRIG